MNIKVLTSQNTRRGVRAFTLIEVLVSVAILAIMLLALYPAFILGFALIKTTREDVRATQILTQKLEAIRLCSWAQLSNCPTSFLDYYNPLAVTNNSQGATYYGTISTTAIATNIPGSASYKSQTHLITMSVTWTNSVNNNPIGHSRQMQTLSAYYGLQNYVWGTQ